MTQRLQIYRCEACGNIIEVLHAAAGELVCCGAPMNLMTEKTEDQGNEKHVPVIEKTDEGIRVKVGEVTHPMENEHYIEWIEVIVNGKICRKFLSPGDAPEAEFSVDGDEVYAREHCTIHGLWKSK